jgi:adenylate cyclase, class 2
MLAEHDNYEVLVTPLNFEFKAELPLRKEAEQILRHLEYRYLGTFHHVDTYFNVPKGNLKIREGKNQNYVMQYYQSPKLRRHFMDVHIAPYNPKKNNLKEILTNTLGIKAIVKKKRRIYRNYNVEVRIDYVEGLDSVYVEVRADTYKAHNVSIFNIILKFQMKKSALNLIAT